MTNNIAEYNGVLEALRFATHHYANSEIEFFTDSKLVVNQVNG